MLPARLKQEVARFEADPQMRHALLGFFVAEANSGRSVFGRNAAIGFPVASSQKVITSTVAFELLGAGYRYKTILAYSGNIVDGTLKGDLHIMASGDPSLGSWRWKSTTDTAILQSWIDDIRQAGIRSIQGKIIIHHDRFSKQQIPDGWIWQDLGNYYGAGAAALNWHENQYDLLLQAGNRTGEKVGLYAPGGHLQAGPFDNELVTAEKGSGDNAYIYLPVGTSAALLKGTIPAGEKRFSVSGALPHPDQQLIADLKGALRSAAITILEHGDTNDSAATRQNPVILSVYYSPALDSLNYWFLKRSINLYGEALVKTIALEKTGYASTQDGISLVKKFWSAKGLDSTEINILDGSGLSPLNRITPQALVAVMRFAKTRPWYPDFYHALPEFNGLRMKSGTIGGVKSFTGYVKNKNGMEYCFAIVVNNFNGPASTLVNKIYRVLNILK